MARGSRDGFTIAELERLLNAKRSQVFQLSKKRADLRKQLDAVDKELASLGAADGTNVDRTAGGRVRNGVNLVCPLESVLRGKPPMKVGDIYSAVLASGYRSTSENFRAIINQTLIKEKRFLSTDRGVYTLK